MALSVTKDVTPIKCSGTTAVRQAIITRPVFIKFVYWYKPTTIGHLFSLKSITDEKVTEITYGYCEAANGSLWFPVYTKYDNVYCDDLDSGDLLIYLG